MLLRKSDFHGTAFTGSEWSTDTSGKQITLASPQGDEHEILEVEVHASSQADIDAAAAANRSAAKKLNEIVMKTPWLIITFLGYLKEEIIAIKDKLIEAYHLETGIQIEGPPGVTGEIGRSLSQLDQMIGAMQRFEWFRPVISTAENNNSRTISVPRKSAFGLVMGPINFILAFGAFGFDLLSMICTGHPVMLKLHENAPLTGELAAGAVIRAAKRAGLPDGTITVIQGGPKEAQAAIAQDNVELFGFTGSETAGVACRDAMYKYHPTAQTSLEMSSINVVTITPGAIKGDRAEDTAAKIVLSLWIRQGGMCTTPTILNLVGQADWDNWLKNVLRPKVLETVPRTIYNAAARDAFLAHLDALLKVSGITETGRSKTAAKADKTEIPVVVLQASGDTYLTNVSVAGKEWFGSGLLALTAKDEAQAIQILESLPEDQLSCTIFYGDDDLDTFASLYEVICDGGARIPHNEIPSGIMINSATHHGGFGSTGGQFSAIGWQSMFRWGGRKQYQGDTAQHKLPVLLRNVNEWGATRFVNLTQTTAAVSG